MLGPRRHGSSSWSLTRASPADQKYASSDDGGLVGRIVEVNKTNSKVELLSDTNEASSRFAISIGGATSTVNGLSLVIMPTE